MSAVKSSVSNIASNIVRVAVASFVSFYITSILIVSLGTEEYGFVAVVTSLNKFVVFFTMSLTASVSRFVSRSFFQDKVRQSSEYYSSAFFGLLVIICILSMAFSLSGGFLIDWLIEKGAATLERRVFLFLVLTSVLANSILSIPSSALFLKHKFYLQDTAIIAARILQLMVLIFIGRSVSLTHFGLSLWVYTVVVLTITFFFARRQVPQLKIRPSLYKPIKLKIMLGMGLWSVLGAMGVFLYTGTDIIIITRLIGLEESAHVSLAVQLALMLALLGSSLNRLVSPVLARLLARKNIDRSVEILDRSIHLMGLFMGLPAIVTCSFAREILLLWLGEDFLFLDSFICAQVAIQIIHQSTSLCFIVINHENRVRLAAIVTIVVGFLNVLLSALFVVTMNFGVWGVFLGTFLSILIKSVLFNTIYTAKILKVRPKMLLLSALKGNIVSLLIVFAALIFSINGVSLHQNYFMYLSCGLYVIYVFRSLQKSEKSMIREAINASLFWKQLN